MHRNRIAPIAALILACTIAATASARPPIPPYLALDYSQARDAGPLGPGCVANYVVTGNGQVNDGETLYMEVRYNAGSWLALGTVPYSYGRTLQFASQLPGTYTTDFRVYVLRSGTPYYSYNTLSTSWVAGEGCH